MISRLLLALLACVALQMSALADNPKVELLTNKGTIVVELDEALAPISVSNFLQYVDDGFYNNTIFHRVIDGFMIQGGGFTTDMKRKQPREPIQNEATNGLKNRRFTIAMARTNQPHSATAQFFINTEDNTFLDHKSPTPSGWGYTVFGKVVEGMSVVEDISTVSTGARGPFGKDVPKSDIVIEQARRIAP